MGNRRGNRVRKGEYIKRVDLIKGKRKVK